MNVTLLVFSRYSKESISNYLTIKITFYVIEFFNFHLLNNSSMMLVFNKFNLSDIFTYSNDRLLKQFYFLHVLLNVVSNIFI